MTQRRVLGIDLSLNHAGYVLLVDGNLKDFRYLTDLPSSSKKDKVRGIRLKIPKVDDKAVRGVWRLMFGRDVLQRVIADFQPTHIGMEDYARSIGGAFKGKAGGGKFKGGDTHGLGEIGGAARLLFWEAGIPFRLHDPASIKMFVTGKGNASKDLVRASVKSRWGASFEQCDRDPPKPGAKPAPNQEQTSGDLCDAYAAAMLVETEIQLRTGLLLPHLMPEKELQVFNRVTKAYGTNILGREWIHKDVIADAG